MNTWEREMLALLARQSRFMSMDQVATAWFRGQARAVVHARRAVRRLVKTGWLDVQTILSRHVRPLDQPICRWRHGQAMPDFEPVVRFLHRRASLSARIATVIYATARMRVLFGDGGRPVRVKLTQAHHDLQVNEILLRYREHGFRLEDAWIAEDNLPVTWPIRQRPDAVLLDEQGHYLRAVEYGGDYLQERLVALHVGLASIPLAYEIW